MCIHQILPSQSILWRNIESGWCNKIVDPSIPRHDPFASALEVAKSTPCNDWKASAKCFATGSCCRWRVWPNNTSRLVEVSHQFGGCYPKDTLPETNRQPAPEKIGNPQKGNEYVMSKRPFIFTNRAVKKFREGINLKKLVNWFQVVLGVSIWSTDPWEEAPGNQGMLAAPYKNDFQNRKPILPTSTNRKYRMNY